LRQHGRIRRALLLIPGAVVLIVAAYALAGFYGGPWLLDRWLGDYRPAGPGRAAAPETIRFNPFTLVAEILGLDLEDPETGAAFAADRIVADLAGISLVQRRPVFSSVIVEGPRIAVASLVYLSALGRQVRDTPLGRSHLEALELTGGTFTAGAGGDAAVELARFDASLTGFDGGSGAAGLLRLDAVTTGGASLESEGTLAADLERSDGRLRLDAVALETAATALGDTVAAVSPRGRLDLSAGYSATSLLTRPRLEMTTAELEFSALSLRPTDGMTVTSDRATATGNVMLEAAATGLRLSGRVEAQDARVLVRDTRAAPPQSFVFADAAVLVTAEPDDGAWSLSLDGPLDGAGEAMVSLRLPSAVNARSSVSMTARSLPAARLSPYAMGALNRRLAAGNADVELEYSIDDDRIDGSLRLLARDLAFTVRPAPDPADDADRTPLELAAALLETPGRTIELDLPFTGDTGSVRDVVAAAFRERIARLTAAPFETLAPLIDGAADANAVPFLPGDAALGEAATASIGRLAGVLMARPRLVVRVLGGYDAIVDREALARQQIELHVQLATADPNARNRPAPVNLDSARVQDVLDEFAAERLPAGRLSDLAARYDCRDTPACRRAYYEQIFAALVANEEIAPSTLSRLGRFRAQSVANALADGGIDGERIEIAAGTPTATAFDVALPIELTAVQDQD
jgi:hypothetical protein